MMQTSIDFILQLSPLLNGALVLLLVGIWRDRTKLKKQNDASEIENMSKMSALWRETAETLERKLDEAVIKIEKLTLQNTEFKTKILKLERRFIKDDKGES